MKLLTAFLFLFNLAFISASANDQVTQAKLKVISSIYPLQQITNAILGRTSRLIADTPLSPHDYKLKPKDIERIMQADLIIWVGDIMMPNLSKAINNKNKQAVITLSDLENIQLLKPEHSSANDNHGHGHEHGHDSHNENYDPHLWLSPKNAKIIAKAITEKLQNIDKNNIATYQQNYQYFIQQLDDTTQKITLSLSTQKILPYYTFHNAYQYFEKAFNIKSQGAIKSNAQQSIKTKDFIQLTTHLKTLSSACIFKEPQFEVPLIKKLSKQFNLKILSLDPVGYNDSRVTKFHKKGYLDILDNLHLTIKKCH